MQDESLLMVIWANDYMINVKLSLMFKRCFILVFYSLTWLLFDYLKKNKMKNKILLLIGILKASNLNENEFEVISKFIVVKEVVGVLHLW